MVTLKKKVAALTMVLCLVGALAIPIGTSSHAGYLLARWLDANDMVEAGLTGAGGALGGLAGEWAGARLGAWIGGRVGAFMGPAGLVIGAGVGAM